jgi:hypothetical protein
LETPIAADAPPISADEGIVDGSREKSGHVAICHDAIHQVFIGGNRWGIGGNRRFQRLTIG